ncbi:hypothetical protein scyTo_0005450, partial [Scyliorhinus torazame]|nr:hypothetical protein [Scyliorhinus torazame]
TGVEKVLQQASQLIIQKVHKFYHHKMAHSSKYKREQFSVVLKASKILPHKSVAELLRSCENLHQGIRSLPHKKASINCSDESEMACKIPAVGDYILTAPQVVGRVVSLPGSSVVEIKIVVAADNSSPPNLQGINTDDRHCIYMDLRQLEWDETHGYWKPQIAIGNKFTSWVLGEEATMTTHEATEKAYAEPKVKQKQKKQSAPLKFGTKFSPPYLQPFTARYKQILLDKKAKAGRKVEMESWTTIMTHEDAELNMEQTNLEVQSKNFNAEQTDKITKAETWASIQIKGKGIMSAVGQRSHSAQIEKSSSLLLQSEEKEIIPLDNDVTNENQEAHSGTQDDCKPEVVPAARADSTENLGTSVKQNKQTCNEGLERPDSASSYQSKCMEAWKNISTETSEYTEAVVKGAHNSLKKRLLKDQMKKETHKTLSIIPLDGGFAESCTVESKRSLPHKSNPDNAPQNPQKHKIGRKKISTGHSLSEQTEIKHGRQQNTFDRQDGIALIYLRMDSTSAK